MEVFKVEAKRLNEYTVPVIISTEQKFIKNIIDTLIKNDLIRITRSFQNSVVLEKTPKYKNITVIEEVNIRKEDLHKFEDKTLLLTTTKGILTNKECEQSRVGGKIIAFLK